MRPLMYRNNSGGIGGHYKVAQRSGELAATIGALGHLASFRWAPGSTAPGATMYGVILRIRVAYTISAAVTDGNIEMAFRAIPVRGFSVDFTTASTAISMSGISNTNKMYAGMATSQMNTVGPRIATTTVMSGQTLTADAAPIGMAVCPPSVVNTNSVGTVLLAKAGFGVPMQTLYEWTGLGDHPPTLSVNEGIVIQPILACFASGTFALYVEWTWAETFQPPI